MGLFNWEKTQRATLQNARAIGATLKIQDSTPAPSQPEASQEGLFDRCPSCQGVLYLEDLEKNNKVCSHCGYHFRLTARERIAMTAEEFSEFDAKLVGTDPLEFPGYQEKLEKLRKSTGEEEAIVTGIATIQGEKAVLAVMDGGFMMGSMGAAVGEKFARAAERAIEEKLPLVAFTVSGGARMQEGLVSLLQMAKTSAVLGKLSEAKLPYIVVLTDPTTGGVTASFGMLGDVTLAEPGALIGFAGKRVIEQTMKTTLPKDFQRAEFLRQKGFIDKIVQRKDLPAVLAKLIRLHKGGAGYGG